MRLFQEVTILVVVALITLLNILPRDGTSERENRWFHRQHGNSVIAGGLATFAASSIWTVAAVYLPRQYVTPVGIGAALLAMALLFISQGWSI